MYFNCTLPIALRLHPPTLRVHELDLRNIKILKFKRAHFKFTVYGRKQVRNAVTLMWGLLRLTPINNKEV